jgi:hypothetical protein
MAINDVGGWLVGSGAADIEDYLAVADCGLY